jgi:hypothetical protein
LFALIAADGAVVLGTDELRTGVDVEAEGSAPWPNEPIMAAEVTRCTGVPPIEVSIPLLMPASGGHGDRDAEVNMAELASCCGCWS